MWTELGHAQLDGGAVNEAIASYLRSGDSSRYKDVIARSQEANAHGDLVKYLLMVRKKVKESKVRPAALSKTASFVSQRSDLALMAVLQHDIVREASRLAVIAWHRCWALNAKRMLSAAAVTSGRHRAGVCVRQDRGHGR